MRSHSDALSTVVADTCAHHAPLIIHVMKENSPATSQAAELLHTIIENSSSVAWIEEIETQGIVIVFIIVLYY